MGAFRCSKCDINYPYHTSHQACEVCGEKCAHAAMTPPHGDWEDRVHLATVQEKDVLADDRLYKWRFDQLKAAGFSVGSSYELASLRDVDLHKAVELAAKAGPELAYRILT